MQTLKNIYQWIVFSSTDPSKVSLTIKGVGGSIVTVILIVAGLTHIQLQSVDLTAIVDSLATVVTACLGAVSTIATLYGAIRKVYLTIQGQHPLQQ